MPSAKASGLLASTTVPAPESSATSCIPPTFVTRKGRPAAIASTSETGNPSVKEEMTNKSARASQSPTSLRSPAKRTRDSIPDRKEHTSELQSRQYLVCRLLLENK